MNPKTNAPSGVGPLRVDGDSRLRVAGDPSPSRRAHLAHLLLRHGLAEEAHSVLPESASLRCSVWRATSACEIPRIWKQNQQEIREATGRDAFELCLLSGETAAAEAIAARTPGVLGTELSTEISLRRGRIPTSRPALGPLWDARYAWVEGDLEGALRHAALAGEEAEAHLLQAAIHRRQYRMEEARTHLKEAVLRRRKPLPALPLEELLQRLSGWKIALGGDHILEATRWAIDHSRAGTVYWPELRSMRKRLIGVDQELGPFRGELISRTLGDGRFFVCSNADDSRFRCAALRMGLRVAPLEVVRAQAARLRDWYPNSTHPLAYEAEILLWFGLYEEAAGLCERAMRLDRYAFWPWIGRAQAAMWLGDLRAAREVLTSLRWRAPFGPSLPIAFGELTLLEGNPRKAVTFLEKAVKLHPTRRSAWLLLAWAWMETGQEKRSEALVTHLQNALPEAWIPSSGRDGRIQAQLQAMKGNRSSSFVTLFPPGGDILLLEGAALHPPIF